MFSALVLLVAIGGYISLIVATIEATFRSKFTQVCVGAVLAISALNTIILFANQVATWIY